jgi:hypothetical protein
MGIAVAAFICFDSFRKRVLDGGASTGTEHLASSAVFGLCFFQTLFSLAQLMFEGVQLVFLAVDFILSVAAFSM